MEPILTREEIAELLAPLEEKDRQRLPEESTDLADAELVEQAGADSTNETQTTLPPEPLPNMDFVLDSFAQHLTNRLTTVLRRSFQVAREPMQTATFADTLPSLQEEGAVAKVDMSPLANAACLVHLDRPLAFCLLETMLGGGSGEEILVPERKLSAMETSLLQSALTMVCQSLSKAMERVRDLQFRAIRVENDFRLLKLLADEEVCQTGFFSVRLGGESCGALQVLLPLWILEHLRSDFAALTSLPGKEQNSSSGQGIGMLDTSCCLRLRAFLAMATRQDPRDLYLGSVLELREDPGQQVLVLLEDQALFRAESVPEQGRRAFRILGRVAAQDALLTASNDGRSDPDVPDVDVLTSGQPLAVNFGCATLSLRELLRLDAGAIICLNQQLPLQLYSGAQFLGQGEIFQVGEKHAIRLLELVGHDTHAKNLDGGMNLAGAACSGSDLCG